MHAEGDIITLFIKKEISLNEAEHFILLETGGKEKFMLDGSVYAHYRFQAGQKVKARIDRINCSGRIFIEPEHPVYKDLQNYTFEIVKVVSYSEKEADILVSDCFGNTIPVKVCLRKANEKLVDLHVAFVRKGIPLLYDADLEQKFEYRERMSYPFKIEGFQKDSHGDDEMVFSDEEGILQFLPARYYRHYHFKPGQIINCDVVRIKPGRILSLEPHHPFLQNEEILELVYVSPLSKEEELHHKHKLHKLADTNGNIYLLSERFLTDNIKKEMHRFRIDAFKKGQVYVEPVN